jgi:hypothetical protein
LRVGTVTALTYASFSGKACDFGLGALAGFPGLLVTFLFEPCGDASSSARRRRRAFSAAQFARWHELASATAGLSELDREILDLIAERYREIHTQGFAGRLRIEWMAAHVGAEPMPSDCRWRTWWNWRCLGSSRVVDGGRTNIFSPCRSTSPRTTCRRSVGKSAAGPPAGRRRLPIQYRETVDRAFRRWGMARIKAHEKGPARDRPLFAAKAFVAIGGCARPCVEQRPMGRQREHFMHSFRSRLDAADDNLYFGLKFG